MTALTQSKPRHSPRHSHLSRHARKALPDSGFSSLEAVVVIPALVVLTMLSVQFVLVWHARNIGEAAARDGLRAAAGYQATAAEGAADCTRYLTTVAGGMLRAPRCTATRSPAWVDVTVDATVNSVVPFGTYHLHESAHGPVDAFAASMSVFTNPDERPELPTGLAAGSRP